MKRITWWPQAWLGLVFSWGALVGWPAVTGELDLPALLLWLGSVAWVIGYDTLYAIQDIEDDALVGVKSLARAGSATRRRSASRIFYALAVAAVGRGDLVGPAGLAGAARACFPPRSTSPTRRCGPTRRTATARSRCSAPTAPAGLLVFLGHAGRRRSPAR